jgi:hypothetical protein
MSSIENASAMTASQDSLVEHRLEVDVSALARPQPERLAGSDDVQPAEDRGPGGLGVEHDRPGVLAGVLDQLRWRVDGVGDGAAQVVVVSAVEVILVAAQGR